MSKQQQIWWKQNRDWANEYQRQWRLDNPEKAKERDRLKRAKYAESIRLRNLEYTRKNKEWARENSRKWRLANPEKVKAGRERRKALLQSLRDQGQILSHGITRKLLTKQNHQCAICSCNLRVSGHEQDHIVALTKGGTNTDENIQIVCPTCNKQKGTREKAHPPVFFSSASDLWYTPQDFYDKLNAEFHFETDVCAVASNAKCAKFFTPEMDGLLQDWTGVCWMNPPYGRTIRYWMEKAYKS